jgi:uncharacterized protein
MSSNPTRHTEAGPADYRDRETIRELLEKTRTIAVVGLSPNPDRPSWRVAEYLQAAGYEIIPVNPNAQEVLGEKCYPDLLSIPTRVDLVNVFRRPEDCLPIAEQAVAIGAKALWLQQGIVNLEAADVARKAGLAVVMDACLAVEHLNDAAMRD